MQIKLTDSLKGGRHYYCEYYVNTAEGCQYACNNVGMLLTKTAVAVDVVHFPYGVLPTNPQIVNYGNPVISDTQNWVKISGIFKASGGEQYLTLGNFKYDTQTIFKAFQPTGYYGATYLVDDVSVIPLDSMCLKADAGKDTAITLGDSVFIGSYTNGIDTLMWLQNGTTKYDSTRPGFWYKPTTTGTSFFVLQQTVNGCTSKDTVYVNVTPLPLKMINYKLLMINERQLLNEWTTANEINVSHFNIQRSVNGKDFSAIGKVKAQNKLTNEYSFIDETPNEGLNYYKIESVDFDGRKQYSETRTLNLKSQTLNGISIYPNPAKDFVTIECNGAEELMIVDYMGRTVYQQILRQAQNDGRPLMVNIKQLTNGVYLVKAILANNNIVISKFIKQ